MSTGKYLTRLLSAVLFSCATLGAFLLALGSASAPLDVIPTADTVPATVLGVWNGSPGSVPAGVHPDVLNDYLYYGSPFPSSFAAAAEKAGATPYVELEPWHGGGTSDCSSLSGSASYYESVGAAVKAGGKPVILTWAHEFNVSGQYPWATGNGCGFTTADWLGEWRDVVSWVRSTAGGLAYFMWAPNADTCPGQSCTTLDPAPWWPGSSYVDMTGVDSYPQAQYGTGTFATSLAPTFAYIKSLPGFTSLPQQKIFVSETDLAPLGSSGYESVSGYVSDLCKDGGDGVLQFQDGTPALTSLQWTQLAGDLKADCGSAPAITPVTPAPTVTAPAPVTTPHAWHVAHEAHLAHLRWLHMLYSG